MTAVSLSSDFSRLWSAAFLSNLSDGVRAAAFPLLAAGLTRDPVLVAGVTVAQQVPWLVGGPISGVVADRVDRRLLLWRVNAVRTLIFALVAMSVVFGMEGLWILYLAAVTLGIGETFYDNATQAYVPTLMASDDLERANGRLVAAEVVGNEFVGPPLGAFLFGVAAFLPFAGNVGVLVLAVVLILGLSKTLHVPTPATSSRHGMREDLAEGYRFVRGHSELGTITLLVGVLAAADAAWFAVLVLYVLDVLGLPASGFGIVLAAGALGGIAGAVGAERLSRRWPPRAILVGALLITAMTQLALGITATAVVAVPLIAISSLVFGVWNVVTISLRQRSAPSALLGRANAIYRTVAMGGAMAGAVAGGMVAELWGLKAPFFIGVPFLVAGAALAWSRLSSPRTAR